MREGKEAGQSRGRKPEPNAQSNLPGAVYRVEGTGQLPNLAGKRTSVREALKGNPVLPRERGRCRAWTSVGASGGFRCGSLRQRDNDEAGTIYLVCSPKMPHPFLPSLGPPQPLSTVGFGLI